MYAPGHMALAYFSARGIQRITGYRFNLIIVWILSILPDIDLLIPNLQHRGPTHSLAAIILVFLISYIHERKWMPYVAAFASHALLGDYFTGNAYEVGSQLLWPINRSMIGIQLLRMGSSFEIATEITLFLIMTVLLLYNLRTTRAARAEKTAKRSSST